MLNTTSIRLHFVILSAFLLSYFAIPSTVTGSSFSFAFHALVFADLTGYVTFWGTGVSEPGAYIVGFRRGCQSRHTCNSEFEMDYERQSRERKPQPDLSHVHIWVSLSGPVGLRGRVTRVMNSNDDQQKVITLLSAIPLYYGGKKEDWEVPPLAGPTGVCPKILADAIWDFQSWWKRVGVFKNIDGVVDPGGNTLRQLNFLNSGLKMSS